MFPKPLSRLLLAGAFVSFAFSGATPAQTAAPTDRRPDPNVFFARQ